MGPRCTIVHAAPHVRPLTEPEAIAPIRLLSSHVTDAPIMLTDLPFALRLYARLPLRVVHAIGALLGWVAYASSPTYRRHFRETLRAAYPSPPPGLARRAIAHAGRTLMEMPWIWARAPEVARSHVVEVSGWEAVTAACAMGSGVVLLTPHLGCFEILAYYRALQGPVTVLYRPPKLAWLAPLLVASRAQGGLKLARPDLAGVRALLGALRRGELVGLLPDQVPSFGEGVWAPFFGRPAYTMTLAARLASPGRALFFVYAERLARGRGYRIAVVPPTQPLPAALPARVAAINAALEGLIRQLPEQYLWGYNRYKVPSGAPPPHGGLMDVAEAAKVAKAADAPR